MTKRKAVFYFCRDLSKDPVASHVLEFLRQSYSLEKCDGETVDGFEVYQLINDHGDKFEFISTNEVISHDYVRYLPVMNSRFGEAEVAAVVNWHEGANAPDRIFCAHTTAEVVAQRFGPANPIHFYNLIHALERYRVAAGLDDFTTTTEASHWSGTPYASDPDLIRAYRPPVLDVEIGSSPSSWSNPIAVSVLGRSLLHVFDEPANPLRSLLCVGGIHFENAFANAVLRASNPGLAVSHILANQWVATAQYEGKDGLAALRNCVDSIQGGVDAIVFHDGLKGPYKAVCRQLGEELGIPAIKHKKLKDHSMIEWTTTKV